jgi:hypothetical protein
VQYEAIITALLPIIIILWAGGGTTEWDA